MIVDIPKVYTALAEWMSCQVIILIVKRRFSNQITVVLSIVFLIAICGVQFLIGIVPVSLWIPGMIVALGLMYTFLAVCCKITARDALFLWASVFMFAEFAASLEWQISSFLFKSQTGKLGWCEWLLMVLSYGVIFSTYLYLEKKQLRKVKDLQVTEREILSTALIAVSAFLLSNISYVYKDTPFSGQLSAEIFYIRTLVDFGGLVMLMSLEGSIIGLQVERELTLIRNTLQQQYKNYELSKNSNELIHQKYHDLKHQINTIRQEGNQEKREKYINEIEEGLADFESQNKTGNAVVDTILTNKQLYCIQHQINLTCVIDGSLLDFMEIMDLCSIFGNALDNAIECVEKLRDPNKRLICIAVFNKNDFLMMRFENYFEGDINLKDMIPQTTKRNRAYHGYGIKSIFHTAEKYSGTAVINAEENWFQLSILLPLPEK